MTNQLIISQRHTHIHIHTKLIMKKEKIKSTLSRDGHRAFFTIFTDLEVLEKQQQKYNADSAIPLEEREHCTSDLVKLTVVPLQQKQSSEGQA